MRRQDAGWWLLILPAFLLIAGGGAGAYFSGLLGSDASKSDAPSPEQVAEAAAKAAHAPPTFLELPDIVVNLSSSGRKSTFLKLNVSLEIESAESAAARLDTLRATTRLILSSHNFSGTPALDAVLRRACGVEPRS